MLTKTVTLALAGVIAAAGAVSAQGFSGAQLQLSAQAGVAPGEFTVPELMSIIKGNRDGHDGGAIGAAALNEAAPTLSAGEAQLAAQAGVEPGVFNAGQLVRLNKSIRDESDAASVQNVKDGLLQSSTGLSQGSVQMAQWLGIDPTGLTSAEIAALFQRAHD